MKSPLVQILISSSIEEKDKEEHWSVNDLLIGVNSIKTFSFNLFHWCQIPNPVAFFGNNSTLKDQNVKFCVYINKLSRNFFSFSPLAHKFGCIFNLIDKLKLSYYFYWEI